MTDVSTVAPVVLYRNTSVMRLVGKVAVEMCALMSRMASYVNSTERINRNWDHCFPTCLPPLCQFNFILYLTA